MNRTFTTITDALQYIEDRLGSEGSPEMAVGPLLTARRTRIADSRSTGTHGRTRGRGASPATRMEGYMQRFRNRPESEWRSLGYRAAKMGQKIEQHLTGSAIADRWIRQGFARWERKQDGAMLTPEASPEPAR